MIINKLNYFPVLILLTILRGSDLQSPSQFLGYDLGDKFTFHHDAVDYFEHVSNGTNHVELINYGDCLLYTSDAADE